MLPTPKLIDNISKHNYKANIPVSNTLGFLASADYRSPQPPISLEKQHPSLVQA